MYFPLFKLHRCANRFAVRPQTIYSEIPKICRKAPGIFYRIE